MSDKQLAGIILGVLSLLLLVYLALLITTH